VRVSSVLFGVVIIVSVISLLCIWAFPSIQDFMASNVTWNGIRDFYREFKADNIKSLDRLPGLPEGTTLVVIPCLEYSTEELAEIRRFAHYGGSLLLMDDYGHGNSVLEFLDLNIRFTKSPLLDPLFCYKNQQLPKIIDLEPEVKENGINVVVLNHATTLTDVEQTEVLAWSSETSFLDINDNGSWDESEPEGPFPIAARASFGRGKVTVVSDPGIMINSMLGRDDNYSFIRYLTASQGEQNSILVDSSHFEKTTLDASKTWAANAREILSTPYPMLGVVALIFIVVSRYTLKIGEASG
jgi:hypothetical protein